MKKLIAIMFLFLFIVGCPSIDVKEVKMQIREDCKVKYDAVTKDVEGQFNIAKLGADEYLKRAENDDDKVYTKEAMSLISRFKIIPDLEIIDKIKPDALLHELQKFKEQFPPKEGELRDIMTTFVNEMEENLTKLKAIQTVYLGLE